MLTACGSKPGTYTFSPVVKTSVASAFQQAGFSVSPDEQALNAISAKYAAQISRSPKSYSFNSSGSLLSSLQDDWSSECREALTTPRKHAMWTSIPCSGSTSEAAVASYYAERMPSVIAQFNNFANGTTGTPYYYIYPFQAVSATDSKNSVWVIFTLMYLV